MSRVALTPDLMREHREILRRLDALEAAVSGPRQYGPFALTTTSIAATTEATFNYAHNLGVTPTMVLFEQEDGAFSGRVITRVIRSSTNVTFVAYNTGANPATVVYRFMILV